MQQMRLAESGFARTIKVTRKQVFLGEKERVVPWDPLISGIGPHYSVAGNGTHPYPLLTMLRIHLMQQWFGYSDAATERGLLLRTGSIVDATLIAPPRPRSGSESATLK